MVLGEAEAVVVEVELAYHDMSSPSLMDLPWHHVYVVAVPVVAVMSCCKHIDISHHDVLSILAEERATDDCLVPP